MAGPSLTDWVRWIGGALRIAGVALIALGIHETRAAFTDRAGIIGTVRGRVGRVLDRLLQRPQTVRVGPASSSLSAMATSARLSVDRGWEEQSLEEGVSWEPGGTSR